MADSSVRRGPEADAAMREPETRLREGDPSAFNFNETSDRSIAELLRDLTHQGSHLAEQQAKLVQAEVRAGITDIKEAASAMAGAAVLGVAALGVLLMSFAYLLGSAMPLWLGTLIVAVVSMGIAYAMFTSAQKKLQSGSLSMDKTRHTLERTPAALTGHEPKEQHHAR